MSPLAVVANVACNSIRPLPLWLTACITNSSNRRGAGRRKTTCRHSRGPCVAGSHNCFSTLTTSSIDSLREQFPGDFRYFAEAISSDEEVLVLQQLDKLLKRRKYEGNHWDDVISQYKEIELSPLFLSKRENEETRRVVERIKKLVTDSLQREYVFQDNPHVVDLAGDGHILGHVDSVKFSGELIAGLSLLSPRILRLSTASQKDIVTSGATTTSIHSESYSTNDSLIRTFDVVIPPRSLYIIRGPLRYLFTHAILGKKDATDLPDTSLLSPEQIQRRISIIIRDELVC